MPEVVGTLKPPRLATAPSSPALGQMYYDTVSNLLYFWNGTAWTAGSGVATDTTLPDRIKGSPPYISDLNNALESGWYTANTTTANAPSSHYWQVQVLNLGGTANVHQFAYQYTTWESWRRFRTGSGAFSAWVNQKPELAYTERTTPLTLTASWANVLVGPNVVYDGYTKIEVEFWCPYAQMPDNATSTIWLYLYEDGTGGAGPIGQSIIQIGFNSGDAVPLLPCRIARRFTPSAGTRSHRLMAHAPSVGVGVPPILGAGTGAAYAPMYLSVTRI